MDHFFQEDFFQNLAPQPQGRVFLGWHRPLAELAAEFLETRHGTELDEVLVVVPSRQSGRRLRDALRRRKSGLPLPEITTPETLYSPRDDERDAVATPGQTLLAWALTLRSIRFASLRNLFPIDPPERTFSWAMGTASDLLGMRSTLGEAALLMRDVPEQFDKTFADSARWTELAGIEAAACARLEKAGLADEATLRRSLANAPSLPAGCSKIALVGLPDPPPIAVRAISNLLSRAHVTVAVFAPESEAARFDAWGQPTESGWVSARIDVPDDAIEVCENPTAQAELTANRIAESPGAAISVADADLIPQLESTLAKHGVVTHLPAGHSASGHELFALLRVVADLIDDPSFDTAAELARHPDVLDSAAASYQFVGDPDDEGGGSEFDLAAALAGLDRIAVEHLPATLADAIHFAGREFCHREIREPSVRHLLGHIDGWLEQLSTGAIGDRLPAFLDQLFAARELDPESPEGAEFAAVRAMLDTSLAAMAPLTDGRLGNAEALRLVLTELGGESLPTQRAEGAIDLQGWLETLWDDTSQLIIAGANDGRLPESMGGDPFLPNRARRELGIRDSNSRLVRDSYLLTAIIESRRSAGRVELLLGRTDADSNPLRPSRLLFRCPDDQLPARALRLCTGEEAEVEPAPAWCAAWPLTPPPPAEDSRLFERISVTGFRSYLSCPFRYYLRFGLGMEEIDTDKVEMDARDFGNLCHGALEDFGNDPAIRDTDDEAAIRGFFIDRLETRVRARYGRHLSVPLAFQLESAKQRLSWAATIQSKERQSGWRIKHTEWSIHDNGDWKIGGLTVRGTIDRIEHHEKDDYWRVLDYKTSATAKTPPSAHLKGHRTIQGAPEAAPWSLIDYDGTTSRWTDLQVPLYAIALRRLLGVERVAAGYFNLARSAGDTNIETWDTLNTSILQSAEACADGIAAAIQRGAFWPPNPSPDYDDFAGILFGDPSKLSLPPAPQAAAADLR